MEVHFLPLKKLAVYGMDVLKMQKTLRNLTIALAAIEATYTKFDISKYRVK